MSPLAQSLTLALMFLAPIAWYTRTLYVTVKPRARRGPFWICLVVALPRSTYLLRYTRRRGFTLETRWS